MAASAAVSVIARSWRGHRSECAGGSHSGLSSDKANGSVPGVTITTSHRKASTLPHLNGTPPSQNGDGRSRSTSIGCRIKDFFRSTVRKQLRSASSTSATNAVSSPGTKLRSKSHSPAVVPSGPNKKTNKKTAKQANSTARTAAPTTTRGKVASVGTQNGYSCSCSIEVLQESPRAGARRTLRYDGIAASYDSLDVESVYSKPDDNRQHVTVESGSQGAVADSISGGDPWEHSSGQSSQGATTDSPWDHSTTSTCTSTSSPRLRTSSCASQCSSSGGRTHPEDSSSKPPRRRAFSSSSSNHNSRVNNDHEPGAGHRPRSNSSRIPTSTAFRSGPATSSTDGLCSVTRASSTPNSTSTPNHSNDNRGIHIKNFRSRLPKFKSPTTQTKASSLPTSPARNENRKGLWPHKCKKSAKQVANTGPADYNYDETISTLRYANRAKNIKNQARVNEDPKDALLRQFQKEIEMLKQQLQDGGVEYGSDEGSEDDSEEEEEVIGPDGQKVTRKKKKKVNVSKERMAEIQRQIEADRKKLEEKKDMEEEEKRKVEEDLKKKEDDLKKAQEEQSILNNKLAALEKKIIVGGENLLEKAEEQERMLEESAKELEERQKKEEELKKALQEKEQERLDIEEKYSSLQEEVAGKTKKLKKVWTMLMQAKSEIADLQQEHQREMEGLLENVRQLSRELHLQMLIIDQFVPPEYQEMIEQYVHWNEDIGEWQLKCVAYTGNNMRKQTPQPDKDRDKYPEPDLSHVYMAYTAEGAEEAMKPRTGKGKKAAKPNKTASKADRPKTSKKKRREQEMDMQ